jgi:hypothetical protein
MPWGAETFRADREPAFTVRNPARVSLLCVGAISPDPSSSAGTEGERGAIALAGTVTDPTRQFLNRRSAEAGRLPSNKQRASGAKRLGDAHNEAQTPHMYLHSSEDR